MLMPLINIGKIFSKLIFYLRLMHIETGIDEITVQWNKVFHILLINIWVFYVAWLVNSFNQINQNENLITDMVCRWVH